MKGLLLKDFYMAKKYCKSYLLIAVAFIALSFLNEDNMFFVFYPCVLCGILPVNLLSYDERSKWLQYSGTMPYSKGQIVSGKFLMGLFSQALILIVTGITHAVRMNINGTFNVSDYVVLMLMLVTVSTITSSISLPFMFKWGVEKGRIAYCVMIGIVCACSGLATGLFRADLQMAVQLNNILPFICLTGIAIYALSWYLSILFYKKREAK